DQAMQCDNGAPADRLQRLTAADLRKRRTALVVAAVSAANVAWIEQPAMLGQRVALNPPPLIDQFIAPELPASQRRQWQIERRGRCGRCQYGWIGAAHFRGKCHGQNRQQDPVRVHASPPRDRASIPPIIPTTNLQRMRNSWWRARGLLG